jgi:hypothetical protein
LKKLHADEDAHKARAYEFAVWLAEHQLDISEVAQ